MKEVIPRNVTMVSTITVDLVKNHNYITKEIRKVITILKSNN